MTLEATLTYLVALAVPIWLLVEQIVSHRRLRGEQAEQPQPRELHKAVEPEAPKAAGSAPDPVPAGFQRKAA